MAYLAESMKKRAIISQAFILLYSILAAILGRTYKTFLVIIAFFIVVSFIQSRLSRGPIGQGRVRVEDVLSDKELMKESGVREIQMSDDGLAKDIEKQSRFLMYMNVVTFISLGYFILFWRMIDPLYNYIYTSVIPDERIAHFLAFLAYFEGYFVVSQVAMYYAMKKAGKIYSINMPTEYTVTKRGIVYKGLITRSAIAFPLPPDVKVRLNDKRKFVEIEKDSGRAINVIRFYTRNPKRLYDVIKRYGVEKVDKG